MWDSRPPRGGRGATKKLRLEWDSMTFEDLLSSWPLPTLAVLQQRFIANTQNPASPMGTQAFSFTPPPASSEREARWHFWSALADAGFVTEEIAFATDCQSHSNCYAGIGASGQVVVHTKIGTVLWMPQTTRLYSPNARWIFCVGCRHVSSHMPFAQTMPSLQDAGL